MFLQNIKNDSTNRRVLFDKMDSSLKTGEVGNLKQIGLFITFTSYQKELYYKLHELKKENVPFLSKGETTILMKSLLLEYN